MHSQKARVVRTDLRSSAPATHLRRDRGVEDPSGIAQVPNASGAAAPGGTSLLPSLADILFIALAIAVARSSSFLNADGDVARHLRLGLEMLHERQLVRTDFFSFTKPGEPFLAFEWGSEVFYALAYQIGGLPAVASAGAMLVAGTYTLVFLLMRRQNVDSALAFLLTMTAALLGQVHWVARPHLFTLLGVACLLHLLYRGSRGRVWLYAPLFALWANLHGGFVLGLVLIGIHVVGALFEAWWGRHSRIHLARARTFAVGLAVGALASLFTPHGVDLWLHVGGFLAGDPYIKEVTQEFQSPNFHLLQNRVFLVVMLVVFGTLAVRRERPRLTFLVVLAFATTMALTSLRHISVFGLLVLPLFGLEVRHGWNSLRNPLLLRVRDAFAVGDSSRIPGVWAVAATVVLIVVGASSGRIGSMQLLPQRFDPQQFPVAAVDAAREAGVQGRMFSEFIWGGYLLYAWPEQKVFIDGGTDFYGPDLTRSYKKIASLESGWREELQWWDISLVLMPTESALAYELRRHDEWQVAYRDEVATLLRRGPFPVSGGSERRADPR